MVTVQENELKIMRPFEKPDAKKRTEGEVFALDWGLRNLFTDPHGNFYGEHLYAWLRKIDEQLLKLQAELQKRGIKPKNSKRYRAFNRRIREHFRNVVGRIFNDFGRAGVQKIVLESLDFRAPNLGRTLNRVLSRFGRSEVRRKTQDIVEKYGITVTFVNPAYTSQQCSACNFVSQSNRSQERFLCQNCGFSAHADHNAAKNILWREQNSFPLFVQKEAILQKILALS